MEQQLEILEDAGKNENRYTLALKLLQTYYLPWPFSTKSFYFYPTREDWKIIRKHIPTILLYITNSCNSHCNICFRNSVPGDTSKDFSIKEISSILKRVGKGKRVVLIGGEPTVREDLFKIIEIIKKSGNHPELFTNGLKLSSLSYVKKLKYAGLERITFSFDGFRKEIYEKVNNNDKELYLKLLALRNLEIIGIDTIISARIVKGLNEGEVKNLIDFCVNSAKRNGCVKGIYFYGATPYGRFLLKGSEISTPELIRLVEKSTNNQVDFKYLIEMKKFALSLLKISSKLGIYFPFLDNGLIGLYKAGSIKRLLPINFLKKINRYLEERKILTVAYEILKNKILRKILLQFIYKKNLFRAITRDGVFLLGIGNVHTPLNFQPIFPSDLGFEKVERINTPLVNASYLAGGAEPY